MGHPDQEGLDRYTNKAFWKACALAVGVTFWALVIWGLSS